MSKNNLSNLFKGKQQPAEIFQQAEQTRFLRHYSKAKGGQAKYFFLWAGGISFALSFYYGSYKANKAQEKINFRKERLNNPVTELTTASGTEFPWSAGSVDEWLYKPVRITGRPIHSETVMIPVHSEGLEGFQYLVPLCTKETEDGQPIEGIFLNKGFIPHEYEHPALRFKIDDSFHQQTFTGYVSKLEDYQEHGIFKGGNATLPARNKWTYADLKDMAGVTRFQNVDLVKAAAIESCNLESPLDERSSQILDVNSDYREDYPYRKTRSGALNVRGRNPYDYKNLGSNFLVSGLASTVLGLSLFL